MLHSMYMRCSCNSLGCVTELVGEPEILQILVAEQISALGMYNFDDVSHPVDSTCIAETASMACANHEHPAAMIGSRNILIDRLIEY